MLKPIRRSLTAPLEVRRAAADKPGTIAGYAAVFNSPADIGGYFHEQIAPGAFGNALAGDVRALFDHDSGEVLGRTTAGTLRLSEDARGLAVEIDLPDTQRGRDLAVSIERGDISGMSFGFNVKRQQWDETIDPPLRTLLELELVEVSVVAFPAYLDTEIALRDLEAARTSAEAEQDRKTYNADQARARIAARRAKHEQKIRGI
jgi:HK97 family phage prohead protease